jgi:hypothetical protein
MKETWRQAAEHSERKHRELQDRILAIPLSQRVLSKLTKEGANREKVLSLLASAVEDKDFWQRPVRGKKRELARLANELEAVANHAQRVSLDPTSYGTLWCAILGIDSWEKVKPAKERAPLWIFGLMRLYATNCRERAKAFGNLLREHPPRQRRTMIDCLLLEVWHGTGKYHDKEIAFLLTNASEAVGNKRVFTEDQIKKQRQKYVAPRIEAYRRLHPAKSATDS